MVRGRQNILYVALASPLCSWRTVVRGEGAIAADVRIFSELPAPYTVTFYGNADGYFYFTRISRPASCTERNHSSLKANLHGAFFAGEDDASDSGRQLFVGTTSARGKTSGSRLDSVKKALISVAAAGL